MLSMLWVYRGYQWVNLVSLQSNALFAAKATYRFLLMMTGADIVAIAGQVWSKSENTGIYNARWAGLPFVSLWLWRCFPTCLAFFSRYSFGNFHSLDFAVKVLDKFRIVRYLFFDGFVDVLDFFKRVGNISGRIVL